MKRNLFKKLAAAAGAAVMALTLVMPMGVSASPADDYPAVGAKGRLTITKYEGDDTSWDETDAPQDPPSGKTPLQGAEFTIKQVGTVSQETYTENGQQKIGMVYTITDAGVRAMLSEKTSVGENQYTSTVLDAALKEAYNGNRTVANKIVEGGTSKKTDESGEAEFTELDQGLYLVAETQPPVTVTKSSVPFFVSIPSIVNAEAGNSQWEMDVKAYPKNSTSQTDIDKNITAVTNDANLSQIASGGKSAEAAIGDTITYQVPVTAIIPDGGLTKLGITDTMSKGLTFVMAGREAASSDVEVYTGNTADSDNKVSVDKYTVSTEQGEDESTVLKVYFTSDYIRELNSAAGTDSDPEFLFVYKAKLNEKAVAGQTGNGNNVKLTYDYTNNPQPDTDVEKEPEIDPKVYTWGIDVSKKDENGSALAGVVFNLYKDSTEGTAMKFSAAENVYTANENGNADLTTDNSGKIYIKGLESGTYYLKETKTVKGYVLLKEPVKIVINGNNTTGAATGTVGGEEAAITADGSSLAANVALTVVNNKGFDLPQTGAAGTAVFAIAGIAIVAAAGALLIFRRKTGK